MCAASAAQFSPDAVPMPISAEPASDMIAHIHEVQVDDPRPTDQVRDPLDTLARMSSAIRRGVDDRRALLRHLKQAVVLDHDQRVDVVAKLLDAHHRLVGALAALEAERPRDARRR